MPCILLGCSTADVIQLVMTRYANEGGPALAMALRGSIQFGRRAIMTTDTGERIHIEKTGMAVGSRGVPLFSAVGERR